MKESDLDLARRKLYEASFIKDPELRNQVVNHWEVVISVTVEQIELQKKERDAFFESLRKERDLTQRKDNV